MPLNPRIRIDLHTFRPLGGVVACSATMTIEEPANNSITLDGKNVRIRRPRDGEDADLDLSFLLNAQSHLLLGITLTREDGAAVSQAEFPRVEIVTENGDRRLTICDMRQTVANYDYAILVQEVGTGLVGLIDPEIENTNQE
ncbi:MAG: hypothetical protein HZC55_02680 [Verrucomicrobia bacterium]|nr:hypothetical protein [Verrucomicrobiota bacterium]